MPYNISNEVFKTKKDITVRCRNILSNTPDNTNIENDSDLLFLFELFKYHDEWEEKSNGGVCSISTQTTEHGTRCFVLKKKDGSKIDISFPHAIKLIPTNRGRKLTPQGLLDFKNAARTAVQEQINKFKDNELSSTIICPYTGEELHQGNSAVDHINPKSFDKLLFDFCKTYKINPLTVEVSSINGVVAKYADENLEEQWNKYHDTNAELRVISKTGNLQLPKEKAPWEEIINI